MCGPGDKEACQPPFTAAFRHNLARRRENFKLRAGNAGGKATTGQIFTAEQAQELWTMNSTLEAIGIHHPKLQQRAVAIGEKVGLYRFSKGCIPPYVPVCVAVMVKRQG